jgi:hypothetical protein
MSGLPTRVPTYFSQLQGRIVGIAFGSPDPPLNREPCQQYIPSCQIIGRRKKWWGKFAEENMDAACYTNDRLGKQVHSPARRMRLGPYHSQKPVMVNTSRASPITVV